MAKKTVTEEFTKMILSLPDIHPEYPAEVTDEKAAALKKERRSYRQMAGPEKIDFSRDLDEIISDYTRVLEGKEERRDCSASRKSVSDMIKAIIGVKPINLTRLF